jgi:hypothetical protein
MEHLLTKISRENCTFIINYILAMQTEVNPSERYRIDTIFKLKQLAEFHNPKSFRDMTRQDIVDFLDRLKKRKEGDAALDRPIIASDMCVCFFLLLLLSRLLLLSPYTFLGNHLREDVHDTV